MAPVRRSVWHLHPPAPGSKANGFNFVADDGAYLDPENKDLLKQYVVTAQDVAPNSEMKLTYRKDSKGNRLHDCRHTFAVNSIRAGDDIKTIQENMGHYSAAFTLDRYGHVTETMRQESANRMQAFIQGMSGNGGGNS